MDTALETAWQAGSHTDFLAIEIIIPGTPDYALRLVTGGFISFDVDGSPETFISDDPTYGALGLVEVDGDGVGAQTTRASIGVLPPSHAAVAALASPDVQGAPVRVWAGCVSIDTGLALGDPELLFVGELDYSSESILQGSRTVMIECGTEEDRQLESDGQRRLSNAFHQHCWPGELGLAFVTGIGRKIYWRTSEPVGVVGGSSGGGDGWGGTTRRVQL